MAITRAMKDAAVGKAFASVFGVTAPAPRPTPTAVQRLRDQQIASLAGLSLEDLGYDAEPPPAPAPATAPPATSAPQPADDLRAELAQAQAEVDALVRQHAALSKELGVDTTTPAAPLPVPRTAAPAEPSTGDEARAKEKQLADARRLVLDDAVEREKRRAEAKQRQRAAKAIRRAART